MSDRHRKRSRRNDLPSSDTSRLAAAPANRSLPGTRCGDRSSGVGRREMEEDACCPHNPHHGHATAPGRDRGSAGPARRTLLADGAAAATPFSIANIFFELNSTAGDLGVHVSLDGESWKILRVQDPQGREIVELEPKRGAKTIGLTELFFEGSEPPLVDVSFARFLELFPQGNYRFLGVTTGNQLLRSTDPLTPELPCPVKVVSPPPDKPVAPDQVVIRWEPAPGVFNPDSGICKKNQDVELASYEVIAEVFNEASGPRAALHCRTFRRHHRVVGPARVHRGRA